LRQGNGCQAFKFASVELEPLACRLWSAFIRARRALWRARWANGSIYISDDPGAWHIHSVPV